MQAPVVRHPLAEGFAPIWASAWGHDGFGPWVEIEVGRAVQRFRWVFPGPFEMGSPEGEDFGLDEGPQRAVVLSCGFWIGDRPCTQALWQAVTGHNPSYFQTPGRPVEQVSWEDCQAFVKRLNGAVPGLDAALPTEAEWECACRAGTTTSTYAGHLEIRGDGDAPLLDAIAWYGGNSGVGFELQNGYEITYLKQRQYAHSPSGTHPVGRRLPNPWGLYDTLGNVWEWCEDLLGPYDPADLDDPVGPRTGELRVVRGGSWHSHAWDVRAAARLGFGPGYRRDALGFRLLARGQ